MKWTRIRIGNARGMAVLEMIPVIIVVAFMLKYSYGFFGVIHSASLQSIAARNYAFETFRHRSRLNYLREGDSNAKNTYKKGTRVHGVRDEKKPVNSDPLWDAGARPISFPDSGGSSAAPQSFSARVREQNRLTSPDAKYDDTIGDGTKDVWLAIRYGMCIDAQCGN